MLCCVVLCCVFFSIIPLNLFIYFTKSLYFFFVTSSYSPPTDSTPAIAFGGVSALAFCDEGKYVWILRGSHTTRVLAQNQADVLSGIDARVGEYFENREDEVELPEKPGFPEVEGPSEPESM